MAAAPQRPLPARRTRTHVPKAGREDLCPCRGGVAGGARDAGHAPARPRPPGTTRALLGATKDIGPLSPAPPESFPASVGTGSRKSRGAAAAADDTQGRRMNFFIAALLVLQFVPGNAEVEDDEEEITQFLFDYAARYSDYLYSTGDYYYDNTTGMPTPYTFEMDSYETNTIGDFGQWFPQEDATTKISGIPDTDAPGDSRNAKDSQDFWESAGPPLQCHVPLVTLLSLRGLLL
ncbi:uncharacterized protein LOC116799617 [Chiroxiphia lanceolata]|uniref:uncharacterized protein LOC116799617 n=1 Tax=Chiroxiphia lanceolata TaxID=296741 RepID=UPI0013CE6411|nr:uncharacterized protein LOC116799617 [Chiroxiphia lanceolata]